MNQRFYLSLNMGYAIFIVMLIALSMIEPKAQIRGFSLGLSFFIMATVHSVILYKSRVFRNTIFCILTVLWVIKFSMFFVSEIVNNLINYTALWIDWLDLLLLLIIFLIVSISFLLQNPFFYIKVANKILPVLGMIMLLCCLWITSQIGLAFFDYLEIQPA